MTAPSTALKGQLTKLGLHTMADHFEGEADRAKPYQQLLWAAGQ